MTTLANGVTDVRASFLPRSFSVPAAPAALVLAFVPVPPLLCFLTLLVDTDLLTAAGSLLLADVCSAGTLLVDGCSSDFFRVSFAALSALCDLTSVRDDGLLPTVSDDDFTPASVPDGATAQNTYKKHSCH